MNKRPLYQQTSKEEQAEGWQIEFIIHKDHPLICDHGVQNRLIVSGAYWIECIASLLKRHSDVSWQIVDLVWLSALPVVDDQSLLTLIVHQQQIVIQSSGRDLVHAVVKPIPLGRVIKHRVLSVPHIKAQASVRIEGEAFYQKLANLGFTYGPSYRVIRHLCAAATWSLSELWPQVPQAEYGWDPAIVDAALQTCLGIAYANQSTESAHVPFSVKCLRLDAPLRQVRFIYAVCNPKIEAVKAYHLFFLDEHGGTLAMMQDFIGRRPFF